MFILGIWKEYKIVDVDDKVPEDHIPKDVVHASYHCGRSVAVALLHDATAVISHMYKEGGVLFRVFFDSDVVVPIC